MLCLQIFGSDDLWPIGVAFSEIPSIVYLISSWWIPDTVFSVARKGNKEKTMAMLKKMRIGDEVIMLDRYSETKQCQVFDWTAVVAVFLIVNGWGFMLTQSGYFSDITQK